MTRLTASRHERSSSWTRERPGGTAHRLDRDEVEFRKAPMYAIWPLLVGLCVLAVTGLVSLESYNLLPSDLVLDTVFIVSAILMFRVNQGRVALVVTFLPIVVVVRFLISQLGDPVAITDFLVAHQWLVYLVLLAFFVPYRVNSNLVFVRLAQWLLCFAVLKYLAARFLSPNQRLSDRPGLFVENNFELPFLAALLAVVFPYMGRWRWWSFAALALCVVLSGSRSAAVVLVILYVYVFFSATSGRWSLWGRYWRALGVLFPVVAVLAVFQSRWSASGIDGIDRFRFLEVLINETRDWSWVQWLFGEAPLTPLSSASCARLSFYQNLFSASEDGSCYSVILHAFLLRTVFDFGLVGTLGAFILFWWIMRWGGVTRQQSLVLLAIAVASSASVSGLNSILTIIPAAIAILSNPELSHLGKDGVAEKSTHKI